MYKSIGGCSHSIHNCEYESETQLHNCRSIMRHVQLCDWRQHVTRVRSFADSDGSSENSRSSCKNIGGWQGACVRGAELQQKAFLLLKAGYCSWKQEKRINAVGGGGHSSKSFPRPSFVTAWAVLYLLLNRKHAISKIIGSGFLGICGKIYPTKSKIVAILLLTQMTKLNA